MTLTPAASPGKTSVSRSGWKLRSTFIQKARVECVCEGRDVLPCISVTAVKVRRIVQPGGASSTAPRQLLRSHVVAGALSAAPLTPAAETPEPPAAPPTRQVRPAPQANRPQIPTRRAPPPAHPQRKRTSSAGGAIRSRSALSGTAWRRPGAPCGHRGAARPSAAGPLPGIGCRVRPGPATGAGCATNVVVTVESARRFCREGRQGPGTKAVAPGSASTGCRACRPQPSR